MAAGSKIEAAEVVLPCQELPPTLAFFTGALGFRIETIFPADEPREALVSGHGLRVRLAPGDGDPGLIRLVSANPGQSVTAPNGTRIEWTAPDPPMTPAPFEPAFVLTRVASGPAPGQGRAGMIYRDLIPGRLGGRYIASHIAVPGAGPVADWVHFHKVAFQLIFCRRGRVRLVYEDQGEPFWMGAGDCVLQPPRIRHRVLESADDLEVVELACPALHETIADHDLPLPTGRDLPGRIFEGQRFWLHRATQAPWSETGGGFKAQATGLEMASGGRVSVRVLRGTPGAQFGHPASEAELLFGFVLDGSLVLGSAGVHALSPGDAFVIPPGGAWSIEAETDVKLLEVSVGREPGGGS